jgi:hypothetical protein
MRRVVTARSNGRLYGEAPFGWRVSADATKLIKDTHEQRVVAIVRHMYLSERMPMRDIVLRLDEMGVVSRRGKPFGLSRVWEMVHRGDELPVAAMRK